ncbi:MAG: glycerol kinase GlpK [Deltaproteobacteria bacterium]|nr:glycerol kinase GlpK [Deltaproteobacteria bacterium]MBW2356028.1 glycerol kinase GlpK [Deltaproteobacteria bacterium]
MEDYIGALDLGTTSDRFIIFDHRGRIMGLDQREHAQIFPRPGWVEHDPMEIRDNAYRVMRNALQQAGIRGSQLAALGIANQRETTVVWDRKTGRPFYNAIVWQCTRTDAICRRLSAEGGQDRFRKRTGLPVATYFSGPKLRWVLDEVPDARAAAKLGDACFGTIESWLTWWLTGGPESGTHVTDVTNASRTLMMNLVDCDWDPEILACLEVPRRMLPRIVSSSDPEIWGYTSPSGPLGARVPVCGALGDQQAALVGQACFSPGEAKNTYGTGCFLLLNTGETPVASRHGLITSVAYRLGGQAPVYCLEGSIAVAGALVQWLRDNLGLIGTAAEVEPLAAGVEDSGGAYIVPAFSGLFAPYWRADARGAIVGLTRYVTKAHLARAALEAVAFQTCDIASAMNQDSGVALTHLKVDGGMVANDLLMQIQADLLGVPTIRPRISETTALGAAYAAGLAVGFWPGLDELRRNWAEDRTWIPQMSSDHRAIALAGWQKAVARTFDWVEG